jgi:hypothetical protein
MTHHLCSQGDRYPMPITNREADIRSAALVLARAAGDDGTRSDIDDVIEALGFDRSQLEAELDAEIADEA